jgi:hypothetical protein
MNTSPDPASLVVVIACAYAERLLAAARMLVGCRKLLRSILMREDGKLLGRRRA